MTIDWPQFLAALLFLLPPIGLFHSNRVRYRALAADWEGYWVRTLTLGMHSIDLARAVLGGWLLAEAVLVLPDLSGNERLTATGIQASVLFLSTILQATVFRKYRFVHAPFAFVTGLVLGFLPLGVAAFAIPLAAAFAFGAKIPAWFFPFLAVTLGGGAFLSSEKVRLPAVAVVAIAVILPWLLTLLLRRELVASYRARPRTDAPATQR